MFTYGSICSGIEAVSVAWKGIGKPAWFSEIEPFPCAILAHHYPNIPNLGDMTALVPKILNREIPAPDVLVGGTPCQAFSVAGKRESLDDDRGNLTLTLIQILEAIDYVRLSDGKQPCILVWENVPGVLSTKDNAFGHFLAGLAQEYQPLQPPGNKWTNAGYVHSVRTISWRVLNAQYFGVAQRRKRVFLVASARKRSVAQILIEQKSLRGNFGESNEKKEEFTTNSKTSVTCSRQVICKGKEHSVCFNIAPTMTASQYKEPQIIVHGTQDPIVNTQIAHCLGRNNGQENVLFEIKGSEAIRVSNSSISPTLKARMGTGGGNVPCIALAGNIIGRKSENGGNGNGFDERGISYTLTATDVHAVCNEYTIRKLTPKECERLQGFPDDYTEIPYRNKPAENCPDSPRYKAIGNSMAVPVMQWIGERVVEYLKSEH
ncbi:cytosine methyltransferase [Nicoletella semolina]|nr:DNA cytosine methyltransferase [Nicoletella semolina]MDH2923973.1 cytosine methyltransferase [Nicoletella semolina]